MSADNPFTQLHQYTCCPQHALVTHRRLRSCVVRYVQQNKPEVNRQVVITNTAGELVIYGFIAKFEEFFSFVTSTKDHLI